MVVSVDLRGAVASLRNDSVAARGMKVRPGPPAAGVRAHQSQELPIISCTKRRVSPGRPPSGLGGAGFVANGGQIRTRSESPIGSKRCNFASSSSLRRSEFMGSGLTERSSLPTPRGRRRSTESPSSDRCELFGAGVMKKSNYGSHIGSTSSVRSPSPKGGRSYSNNSIGVASSIHPNPKDKTQPLYLPIGGQMPASPSRRGPGRMRSASPYSERGGQSILSFDPSHPTSNYKSGLRRSNSVGDHGNVISCRNYIQRTPERRKRSLSTLSKPINGLPPTHALVGGRSEERFGQSQTQWRSGSKTIPVPRKRSRTPIHIPSSRSSSEKPRGRMTIQPKCSEDGIILSLHHRGVSRSHTPNDRMYSITAPEPVRPSAISRRRNREYELGEIGSSGRVAHIRSPSGHHFSDHGGDYKYIKPTTGRRYIDFTPSEYIPKRCTRGLGEHYGIHGDSSRNIIAWR